MNKSLLALSAAVSIALFGAAAPAAEVIPVFFDDPGEGYNDPTAVAPVGGNPGTTRGEQRRIVAQFGADLWGAVLESEQPVFVGAQFNPLGAGVLGSAGATFVFANFAPGIVADTWYSSALADAISGEDLEPGFIDINSQFSSNFDFYYGLDGQTPAGQVNFLDVVMHEIGHGLGFQNFENEATGTFFNGIQDIYSVFTFDNTVGKYWTEMTIPERQASALNYGNVVFDGPRATLGAALTLGPRTAFRVTAPVAIAGEYSYGTAGFGPAVTPDNFSGNLVLGTDGVGASNDGCEPLTNFTEAAGNIVMVDRGTCAFTIKAANAQAAGATGVVIANNAAGSPPPGLGGADPAIAIPVISVTQPDGATLRSVAGVQVALVLDPSKLQGADDAGRPRLYMPNPVVGGSSGSHYDTALAPNALMEPSINATLFSAVNLDISPHLLEDTGWTINAGNAVISNCDTGIDVVDDSGLIIGANVQASSNMCLNTSASKDAYQDCMGAYKDRAVAAGILTGKQGGKVMSCAAKILK